MDTSCSPRMLPVAIKSGCGETACKKLCSILSRITGGFILSKIYRSFPSDRPIRAAEPPTESPNDSLRQDSAASPSKTRSVSRKLLFACLRWCRRESCRSKTVFLAPSSKPPSHVRKVDHRLVRQASVCLSPGSIRSCDRIRQDFLSSPRFERRWLRDG